MLIHFKTTSRFHINLVRMAINNRSESQFGKRCGKTGTLSLLVGMKLNMTFVEKVRIFLLKLKIVFPQYSTISFMDTTVILVQILSWIFFFVDKCIKKIFKAEKSKIQCEVVQPHFWMSILILLQFIELHGLWMLFILMLCFLIVFYWIFI